ncbi:cysteine hydrolase [Anaerolentibacter hominis]|uniref:cysteine hydrolase family protein n=1 Tax=Anaerolentibacter hominis TaxID=3079009 RepID=UPI0031B845CF
MNKILIVVDMQNDFIDGALGNPDTLAVVKAAADKIRVRRQEGYRIYVTMDTHDEHYMDTQEGKKLPVPHCIKGTDGWQLNQVIAEALGEPEDIFEKNTFASLKLVQALEQLNREDTITSIELVGVCTGICVLSNAVLLKAHFTEVPILVDASCCACVTRESHRTALDAMKLCQIEVAES